MIKPGIWKHSKSGNEYRLIGIGKHTETLEDLVIYEALYKNEVSQVWARPVSMWEEEVEIDGKKVEAITGKAADPWDIRDAFLGTGLLLRDNGAGARTYTAERTAALKYLAGSNWKTPSYAFYGDDVMGLARKYQEQIDILSKVAQR